MTTVLTVVDYYVPGYKGGGPIRSIAHMVARFGDEIDFRIITRDRDLGDTAPYTDITPGAWQTVGKAQVLYLNDLSFSRLAAVLNDIPYDRLYLNSFFSSLCVKVMILHWRGRIPSVPVIIAPRGEFYAGALALKATKKRAYLQLTRGLGIYKQVIWHATTADEQRSIRTLFPAGVVSVVTPDLPTGETPPFIPLVPVEGDLKIVFLSRISRKKNLDYALRLIAQVKQPTQFDIYGPIEDAVYWRECTALIDQMPAYITVTHRGDAHPEAVRAIFAQYHLFLFPTRGENFGHVIWEALYAGCPVLTSDQTPWHDLERHGIGWTVPLSQPERFVQIIEAAKEDNAQRGIAAQHYAILLASDAFTLKANRKLFTDILDIDEDNPA